jgi:hypothetical protein
MEQELDDIFNDPNYDQSMLQAWFQQHYGDAWQFAWDRYLETGIIPRG